MKLLAARVTDWVWYQPNPLQWVLWPLGWVYRAAVSVRRSLYRLGLRPVSELAVPVIVVGNISVGGTGKTPCVIWLAGELQSRGFRVGIISRGYGGNALTWPQRVEPDSDPSLVGDEPVLLRVTVGCPVVVGPDRVAAAERLLAEAEVDVLLSDDGLQHYALARTMEICVVDGERGLGNGLCLPAGPLREPASRIREVDAIVVNGGSWGHAGVFRATAVPQRAYQVSGTAQKPLAAFRDRQVHAVAGIGNPQRFFDLLENADVDVIPHPLPDHAPLTRTDLEFGDDWPVLVTEKDAVKCRAFAGENVWSVPVKLEFGRDDAERLMRRVIREL